jgi:phage-related tail protein
MALDMTTALTIRAKVDGLGQISGLTKGLGGVTNQSNAAAGAMGRLRGAAAGAMGAMRTLLPVLGVGAMAKFAKDNLDAADAMSKMSQRTGVAAPMLDKFRKVAELSDTSIEGLGKGFKTLASNMYDAQTRGTGPAADAFNKLGIAVADSSGKLRSSDQVMLDIADRFKAMADGPEKAALAADLFGAKIGGELIPLLNSGGDAVRNMGTSMTQEFADKAAAFNDRLETMQEKLGDVGLRLTEALLPALEKLVGIMEGVGNVFSTLPQPLQDVALVFTAIAIPVAAIAVPLGALLPLFTALGAALASIGPILAGIPALIAGWAGAIGPLVAGLGTLAKILIGVFSGPVGWVALAVAAGVAIYAFRDQIGQAFQAIGGMLQAGAARFKSMFIDPVVAGFTAVVQFVNNNFVQPVQASITGLVEMIGNTFKNVTQAITSPFQAAFQTVRGIVNNILNGIGNAVRGVVQAINNVIAGANRALARLKLPQIPSLPQPNIPRFAEGGVVSGPTLAMVGEGSEPEYIVPQSKASGFAANWMAGQRGAAAIPGFAKGGVVMPSGAVPRFAEGGMVVPGNAQVSIQTGPVTQMNGQNYVTTQDLSRAVQAGVQQTLNMMRNDRGTRRAIGLA